MQQEHVVTLAAQLDARIADKSLELPMLPQVTSQVLSLVNDVDSDAAALAKLIQSDQALAGHVMRIANSAAYSPNAQMTSLQQAIARLGMQTISEVALAATMGPKMFIAKGFEALISDIWSSSLATAVWAREIARQARRNVESTFLCGLLFQIGKPVVLQTILDIADKTGVELSTEEAERLMADYQQKVGEMLSEHWQLPSTVAATISGVSGNSSGGAASIIETVRAARVFAAVTISGREYNAEAICVDPDVIDMNLYLEDVEVLLAKAESIHETIAALTF